MGGWNGARSPTDDRAASSGRMPDFGIDPDRCLRARLCPGAGTAVRRQRPRDHHHLAPSAASARHGHRCRDWTADRTLRADPRLGPAGPGARVEWLRQSSSILPLGNGRYDLRGGLFPDQGLNRSIRIEAEGYLPAELLGFRDDAEDIAHDFKLRKATPLSGVVRGSDGKPVAGAEVALSNSDNYVRIENGHLMFNLVVDTANHTKTGWDGRYTFRPQEKPVAIVAAHEAGFGVRPRDQLAPAFDVTLVPWGRIEGVLKIGKNHAPNKKVSAWLNNHAFDGRIDYETTTDEHGRFVFERVTPARSRSIVMSTQRTIGAGFPRIRSSWMSTPARPSASKSAARAVPSSAS